MTEATVLERVAEAYEAERERWVGRTNKAEAKPYEICRFDDSGFAGSFSEIHSFATYEESAAALDQLRNAASARAAVEAMREPPISVALNGSDALCDAAEKGCDGVDEARICFAAMIDSILNQDQPAKQGEG